MTDKNNSYFFYIKDGGAVGFKCFGSGSYKPLWAFNKYVTSDATFMYRFDKETPVTVDSDQMGPDHRILFLGEQRGFLERALSADRIVFQARDRDGDVITMEYDLRGLREALDYANNAMPCN